MPWATTAALAGCGSGGSSSTTAASIPQPTAYVVAQHSGEIDRFDAARLQRTAAWSIGGDPHIVVADTADHLLWVSSPQQGTVRAVDPATGQVVAALPVRQPDGLALTADQATLLVTSGLDGPGTLQFIDTHKRTVTAKVAVGSAPHAIAISPDATRAYVVDQFSNDIAVVDIPARKLVGKLPVPGFPYDIAVHSDRLYVDTLLDGTVVSIDLRSGEQLASWPIEKGLSQMAVSSDGRRLYVAVKGLIYLNGFPNGNAGDRVAVVDTGNGASVNVSVPRGPDGLILDGGVLLVTSLGLNDLSRVDTASLTVTSAPTAMFPTAVAVAE